MGNTRIWVLGGGLLIVVILVLGGLLGVKPQLDAAQASNSEREAVEALNLQHAAELASLKAEFENIATTQARVAALRTSVPGENDLDTFTGELAALQAAHGVSVTSYAPQERAYFEPTEDIAAEIPAGIDNTTLATISVSITVVGPLEATLAFVEGLQKGTRLTLISSMDVAEVVDGVTTVSLTGLLYVMPEEPFAAPTTDAATSAPTEAVAAE
jgi:Tfp pilus assembly protein PilO